MLCTCTGCGSCRIRKSEKKLIVRRAWDAINKWYAFGYELDIATKDLDAIIAKYNENHERFINIVELWFSSSKPTWYKLASILMRPFGFKSIAIEIMKEYCSDCCYKQIDSQSPLISTEPLAKKERLLQV